MNPSEIYKLWAPEDSIWSNWVKPILFADRAFQGTAPAAAPDRAITNLDWAPANDSGTAIILDLPGADAVWAAIALSQQGFRPVALFNGVRSPASGPFELVNVEPLITALRDATEHMAHLQLSPDAPPAFLLDANRSAGLYAPGKFDNRWCVFPQDFPSANFLIAHGIRAVIWVRRPSEHPNNDLSHVLLRWQEAGIQILACGSDAQTSAVPILVSRPSRFRALWYQALVLARLRRNSAGGFGAVIPEPNGSAG